MVAVVARRGGSTPGSQSSATGLRSREEARPQRFQLTPMAAGTSNTTTACTGLTAAAVRDSSSASFHELCRVVGTKWGAISAETLLNMRRSLPAQDASAAFAFQQIFIDADVPASAELITRTASTYTSFGQLLSTVDSSIRRVTAVACPSGRARARSVAIQRAARCIAACIGNCCITAV